MTAAELLRFFGEVVLFVVLILKRPPSTQDILRSLEFFIYPATTVVGPPVILTLSPIVRNSCSLLGSFLNGLATLERQCPGYMKTQYPRFALKNKRIYSVGYFLGWPLRGFVCAITRPHICQ